MVDVLNSTVMTVYAICKRDIHIIIFLIKGALDNILKCSFKLNLIY